MNIFDTLPRGFFLPLASRGAEIYLEALFALWETQRFHPLLERPVLLQHIEDALQRPYALEMTEADIREVDADEASKEIGSPLRTRAGTILRYLLLRGWLCEEEPTDFERVYTLPHYAQKLLEVLSAIGVREHLQLRGMICSIRDLLVQAAQEGTDIEVRIPEAYRQTVQLRNGFSTLQAQMREHIQQVARQKHTSKVLAHFSGYYDLVSDVSYKHLKTTDHVSRFRPQILDAISQLDDTTRLLTIARKMHALQETPTESEALYQLEQGLAFVREQFEALHKYLTLFDDLNSQYTDTVTRAIQRDIYAYSTVSGRLQTFLQEWVPPEGVQEEEKVPEVIGSMINLFTFSFVDADSLAVPRAAPMSFTTQSEVTARVELQEDGPINEDLLKQMRLALQMSRSNIQDYVAKLLAEQQEIRVSTLPLSDAALDYPRLILLWAYGDGSLEYLACPLPDSPWVDCPELGFGFVDFVLRRADPQCAPQKRKKRRKE